MLRVILPLIILISLPFLSHGQDAPFNYSVEFKSVASTNGELPFWYYANRWGEVDLSGANAILNTGLSKNFFEDSNRWNLEMGTELTSRYSENSSAFLKQLYAKVDYSIFQLQAGRFEEITGNVYRPLSMGSMSFSGNATPLPKIKLSIPEYQPLPLSQGYIEIRGAWGHGWMEEERYTSNALLVEQYGYARLGGDLPVNLIGGIHHFALWGGNNPDFGHLPQSLKDYFDVALALGDTNENAPIQERQYFLGDHKGYWDFGAEIDLKSAKISLYRQFILEDKDNIKFKSPQDGLYGLSIENKENGLLKAFLWEFLYTKWQNGPIQDFGDDGRGGIGGRDNYYNNNIYKTGWTYFGKTIGTPLLFPRSNGQGIANNRMVAQHFGIEGQISSIMDYKTMFTYSRNYGTYSGPFEPRLDSYSVMASSNYQPNKWDHISFNASMAADFGELYGRNLGLMIGVKWSN